MSRQYEQALADLIEAKLRRDTLSRLLVGLTGGRRLVSALPGDKVSWDITSSAAAALLRKRRVDAAFLNALASEQPFNAADIEHVRQLGRAASSTWRWVATVGLILGVGAVVAVVTTSTPRLTDRIPATIEGCEVCVRRNDIRRLCEDPSGANLVLHHGGNGPDMNSNADVDPMCLRWGHETQREFTAELRCKAGATEVFRRSGLLCAPRSSVTLERGRP